MKKYILTIKYDDENEDIEFLSEEITVPAEELGTIDLSEWFDKDILELIDECYIIGKA